MGGQIKVTLALDAKDAGAEAKIKEIVREGLQAGSQGTTFGQQGKGPIKSTRQFLESVDPRYREAFSARNPHLAAQMQQLSKGVSESVHRAIKAPPVIADYKAMQQKNILAGLLAAPVNPYLSARAMMAGFGGGGGGGGMGMIGFGGGGGGRSFLPLTVALIAAKVGMDLLRGAIRQLNNAIEQGARLYQQSAAAGRSPFAMARLQTTLGPLGVGDDQIQRMLGYGQFGGERGRGVRGAGMVDEMRMAAVRVGGLQTLQMINNLASSIRDLGKYSQDAAHEIAATSKSLFETKLGWEVIKNDWRALWSDLAEIAEPIMQSVQGAIHLVLAAALKYAEIERRISEKLGLSTPTPSDEFHRSPFQQRLKGSQYESMGFVFGTGGPNIANQKLSEIAQHTAETAAVLKRLQKAPLANRPGWGTGGSWSVNMP